MIFFLLLSSLVVVISKSSSTIIGSGSHCATLYSQELNKGNKFTFRDGDQVSDFAEHYVAVHGIWNVTKSIQVNPGCVLTSCNESYFDGICNVFKSNVNEIRDEFQNIASGNCTCPSTCKCEDVRLRRSECARGYLGTTCNSCHAYYVDLRGEKEFLDESFKSKIKSLVVRSGCEIEVFDEEDFEGESTGFSGIHQDFDQELNSYKCTCSQRSEAPKPPRIRESHYPKFVTVPNTADAIKLLLNEHVGHEGLVSSLKSIKSKRSPKNAYILLLGLTGAGKSSAINLLFDNPNVTKVGDGMSTTSDIHEFRIPIPLDELGLGNTELRVIDTPGLGDTRGLEQDARFLSTLEEYLTNHEDLSKYIPNVVLVFAKFNDNRFQGVGSNFVKMLRGLDLMQTRLTDKKFSNVVFVLSHFLSEIKETVRKPGKRLAGFKKTIDEYCLMPKPITIVVAENKAQEEGLPMLNGYFKLPNGDFYPRNLFDKMQMVTLSGDDPIGEAIIRSAFRNSDNFNVSSISTRLVSSQNMKALKYLGILSGANFKMNDTEISKMLADSFEKLNATVKRQYPDALPYLQRSLTIRNIHSKSDIPRTTLKILELLKEIRLNDASVAIIESAFKIKIPILPEGSLQVGYGYNAVDDLPLPISPFKQGKDIISDIVFRIPEILSCRLQNEKKSFYKKFKNSEEYFNFRMESMDVKIQKSQNVFQGKTKPGYNIIWNIGASSEPHTISAVKEYRTFQLILNDNVELTPEFTQRLRDLPKFNQMDYNGIEIWKDFFKRFGTHVVKSAFGGGSIEVELKTEDPSDTFVAAAIFNILEKAEDLTFGLGNHSHDLNYNYSLKFKGGDFKYQVASFSGINLVAAANLMESWKNSIQFNPVVLESDIKLLPISEVAKQVGLNISADMQLAALALLNSSLTYVPPDLETVYLPDPRELIKAHLAEIKEADNEFTFLIGLVREDFKASNAKFDIIMSDVREREKSRRITAIREAEEDLELERQWEARRKKLDLEELLRDRKRRLDLELERRRANLQILMARNRGRGRG